MSIPSAYDIVTAFRRFERACGELDGIAWDAYRGAPESVREDVEDAFRNFAKLLKEAAEDSP